MNHYEILEVSTNASQQVIRVAYKSLMQRYHPDRNPDNAEAAGHALRVNQAYEVLSDANRRAAYDIELKQQSADPLNGIRDKRRSFAARPASIADYSQSPWLVWLLIASIFVSGWLIVSLSGKQASPKAELQTIFSEEASARAEEARTIPVFIEKMTVKLKRMDKSSESPGTLAEDAGETSESTEQILFIPILGIRVGTFDPEKAIAYIERNKDAITQKLAERLTSAKYEELNADGGENYLKNMILDSVEEATGTNRREDYPSSATEAPGRYGAMDVLLPKSFSVR